MIKTVFLTGHRKSGTTMLFRLFDDHPELNTYPPDLSVFYGYFPHFAATLSDADARARVELVVRKSIERVIRRLPEGVSAPACLKQFPAHLARSLTQEALRDRGIFLKQLLEQWIALAGLDPALPVVVKETSQAAFFEDYSQADGIDLRMVSLLRDPRDNYAALKAGVETYYSKMSESERETLASAINRIKFDFTAAAITAKTAPSRFETMRFEDLVQDPHAKMQTIASWLRISYQDSLTRPTVFGETYAGNNHDGVAFSGIASDHLGQWRQRISPDEAKIIEFWLSVDMRSFGYEPFYCEADQLAAFAKFYDWYNHAYFFRDSFTV
ncbi:MAG: hypothetical protein MnENMB40S_15590 [Rhizobiaceae bacterium MnEN-MB40S]|nr:MAG: hypothetical protein MnENMB40S_15590 [Rhizobiaceae bacterium MnEN-MB40S]